MQIGFALPVSGTWATPENVASVARTADRLGYPSLWTFQRLLVAADQELAPVYQSVLDPIVTLAYAAAVTERVRLGLAIVNLPFVSPILLAKQLTTLDGLSLGRLDVGLGLGWSPEEFLASGVSYERRGARAVEFIRCLRTIWADEVVEFAGEFYSIPPARVQPKPAQQPGPPILLGGTADAALRRVGTMADGWISSSRADLSTLGASIRLIKQAAVAAGRDPAALRFIVRGVVLVRPEGTADRQPLTGTIAQIRGDFERLAEQGATEVFIDLNFDPEVGSLTADAAASMARAEELLHAFAP